MPAGKKASKSKPAAKSTPKPALKKAAAKAKPVKAANPPKPIKTSKEVKEVKAAKVGKPVKPVKAPKKTAVTKPLVPKVAAPVKRAIVASATAKHREKKFNEFFGPAQPRGKGLNVLGEPISADEFEAQGWCILQFPPPAGRMSWIYATHGLSTSKLKNSGEPARVELVMHWREKHTLPLQLLSDVAKYILETGNVPAPGHIITAEDAISANVDLARHCVALEASPMLPTRIEIPGGHGFTPLVLLGISDAELEYALKVPPQMADGKLVLIEALRQGGVYPVTDPKRLCLTRRRDFNKVWETAFRTIRERK